MKIGLELDHDKALAAYQAAGHPFPAIPAGCNTFYRHFTSVDGDHAVIINQRGGVPLASDNEEQINGCSLAVAIDPPDAATARATLEKWVCETLEITP